MSKDANYNKLIQAKQWKMLRKRKLTADPLCEDCLHNGLIEPATEIHHVLPVENATNVVEMGKLMYDYDNLRSLCHNCHQLEHVRLRSRSKEYVRENASRSTERFKERYL